MSCFKQALPVLAHLRKNETFARVAAGFGGSEATAWRYSDESGEVLAAWAPGPREALAGLGEGDFVIIDGTLIPTDRVETDEPYHSQKHRTHGMNVQVVAAPDGTPLWFSRALPSRTHDLTAARAHGILQACPNPRGPRPGGPGPPRRRRHLPHPPTTTTTNCPSTTSSTTATTPDSERPANGPSPS